MKPATNSFDADDVKAMERALEIAALGLETTDPNPRVGCVLVRNGAIVAEGWHARAGEAHAEILALEAAGGAARGATAYVTLEPCNHFGRTPPCTDALISAGVERVVFATEDPNPKVHGKGALQLRAAGIKVEQGLCANAAESLNAGFFKRMRTGQPLIRLKMAMSLDGRTALANGQSQWITGEAARADVQRWRARSSAVLTGIGTVLADDPRLTVREPANAERQPVRVILDAKWQTPRTARIFADSAPVVIVAEEAAAGPGSGPGRGRECLAEMPGIRLLSENPHNLPAVITALGRLNLNEILVEAGPTLAGSFLAEGLVDELIVYIAPILLGPQARPMAVFPALEQLRDAHEFEFRESSMIGPDLRLILRRKPNES